jgi:hypothetical protein
MIGKNMAFNLDDYQTVAERLDQAIKDHPDLRIITHLEHVERIDGRPVHYIFKAEMWLGTILLSTGWADEIVGSNHMTKSNACEIAETSAIGRCLANAGYQGKKNPNDNPAKTRPTREEMQKAERYKKVEQDEIKAKNPLDWGEPTPPPPADDPFASWDVLGALGAQVIETKPKVNDQPGNAGQPCTDKQQKMIRAVFAEKHPDGDLSAYITEVLGDQFAHLSELDKWQASMVINKLKG